MPFIYLAKYSSISERLGLTVTVLNQSVQVLSAAWS